jgi:transposase
VIEHPPGHETQWDWLELPDPPTGWGWDDKAHLLVGALACSGKWRGVLVEAEDQAHLVDGLDRVVRRLGGLTRRWRFDRMATVCQPATGRLSASFAGVAKHYGVEVDICPARHGNRKGVVEKANHAAAQRWWRTLGDDEHRRAGAGQPGPAGRAAGRAPPPPRRGADHRGRAGCGQAAAAGGRG